MKLRKSESGYTLTLNRSEHSLLSELLKLYPVNTDRPVITRGKDPSNMAEHQQLLESYLAEHRRDLQKVAAAMLPLFPITESSLTVSLGEPELDMLLQIINEVRVGCWIKLGRFDPAQEEPILANTDGARAAWAMEAAGLVQSLLLQQLRSGV